MNRTLRRICVAVAFYVVADALATALDLTTTVLALHRTGAHEQNPLITSGPAYPAGRAFIVNVRGR